jgi:hypothetical protein
MLIFIIATREDLEQKESEQSYLSRRNSYEKIGRRFRLAFDGGVFSDLLFRGTGTGEESGEAGGYSLPGSSPHHDVDVFR